MRADRTTKITILEQQEGYDSYGEPIDDWLPVEGKSDIWASKEPILGNEYFAAESTQSKVEVKFRTHFMKGVTNEMRIRDSEGTYEILSAINVKNLNRELLMYCKKVT